MNLLNSNSTVAIKYHPRIATGHHTQMPAFGQMISCDVYETQKVMIQDPGPWCKVNSYKVQSEPDRARIYLCMLYNYRRTVKCQSFY